MAEPSFEREVIGAMLKDAAAWEHLSQVHPSDFSTDNGRILWGVIADLVREETIPSVVTVVGRLANKLESIGGYGALLELHDLPVVLAPKHLAHCARKIREAALGRRLKVKSETISLMNGAALADVQQAVVELAEIAAESASGGGAIQNLADIPSLETLDFPDPCFAVPDVLPYQRVTVLAGQAGSGKTLPNAGNGDCLCYRRAIPAAGVHADACAHPGPRKFRRGDAGPYPQDGRR